MTGSHEQDHLQQRLHLQPRTLRQSGLPPHRQHQQPDFRKTLQRTVMLRQRAKSTQHSAGGEETAQAASECQTPAQLKTPLQPKSGSAKPLPGGDAYYYKSAQM
jgi:hypothetical protein